MSKADLFYDIAEDLMNSILADMDDFELDAETREEWIEEMQEQLMSEFEEVPNAQ